VKGTITQHGSAEISSSNVGGDIWSVNDKFSFAHTTVPESRTSSFEVVFKTNGFSDGAYDVSKFGLMIRDTLQSDSKHFSVVVLGKKIVRAMFRKSDSGNTSKVTGPNLGDSGYLKLVKAGNVFYAFHKNTESSEYELITTQTIDMMGDLHVGIALVVHDSSDNQSETVSFSDFSLVSSLYVLLNTLLSDINFNLHSCGNHLLVHAIFI
jgi:TolB protein